MIKRFLVISLFLITLSPAHAVAVRSVAIDPGHGGFDPGLKEGALKEIKEKGLTLMLAKELEAVLKGVNKTVILTRKTDRYLSVKERVSFVSRLKADVFISIHAADSKDFAVYVSHYPKAELPARRKYSVLSRQKDYLAESGRLQAALGDALKNDFKLNVSLREIPLPVLSSAAAPAVLVEVPFSALLKGKPGAAEIKRIAASLVKGIIEYENK